MSFWDNNCFYILRDSDLINAYNWKNILQGKVLLLSEIVKLYSLIFNLNYNYN